MQEKRVIMQMEQVMYLKDIEKTNSITQTAERFYITQQALSYSLKKLEKEFDAELFKRTSHGVILTDAGKDFLYYAENLLEEYQQLRLHFANRNPVQQKEITGIVRVGCLSRLLDCFLIDIIEKAYLQCPNIKMIVLEETRTSIIKKLVEKEIDLGIFIISDNLVDYFFQGSIEQPYPDTIDWLRIYRDVQVICMKKDERTSAEKFLGKNIWTEFPFCRFNNSDDPDFRNLRASVESFPDPFPIQHSQFFSNNISFHKNLIKRGLAVNVISSFEFSKNYRKHTYLTPIPFDFDAAVSYYVCWNKKQPFTEAIQKIYDMIVQYPFS